MANEKRLVNAHDLWSDIMILPHNGDMISSEEVEQAIMEAPTVDAVEVVRCKDCKWAKPSHKGWVHCTETDIILGDEEFCSCGERRAGK